MLTVAQVALRVLGVTILGMVVDVNYQALNIVAGEVPPLANNCSPYHPLMIKYQQQWYLK